MTKRERVSAADPLDDLFRKPTLWEGESEESYLNLLAMVESEMSPANLFDKIRVHDFADKIWQERRLKRTQAALIGSARVESLAGLLSARFGDNLEEAVETAQDYYSGNPERMRRTRKLLVEMAITSEQIEANALHLRSAGIQALDRMITYKETARNALMKGHEKRQRKAKKAKVNSPSTGNAPERVIRLARQVSRP